MCVNKFSLAGKSALVICPENNWGPEVVQGLKAAGCKVFLAGPNKEAMKQAHCLLKFRYLLMIM